MILELALVTPEEGGGKAVGLARLAAIGLPVPETVVVPASARGVLDADPVALAGRLGLPLAVRSSAVGEDALDRSAAGQFESLMGVTAATLGDAVSRVWRSAASDRARTYTGGRSLPMAVVVQRQVAATRSGVAFSRDPVSGEDEIVVECVFGLGEGLMSGLVTPDRYRVARDGTVRARIAEREGQFRVLRGLRDDETRSVAELVRRAESGFGRPVDIEFCFEGSRLWAIQCRPITVHPGSRAG